MKVLWQNLPIARRFFDDCGSACLRAQPPEEDAMEAASSYRQPPNTTATKGDPSTDSHHRKSWADRRVPAADELADCQIRGSPDYGQSNRH
jgi:hypothetical protein